MGGLREVFLTFLPFFLIIPATFSQLTVGVSPPFLDLGEIEPGTSRIGKFYVVTSSDEVMLVRLSSSKGGWKAFKRSGYEDFLLNYSEEDVSSWVEFIRNPVKLNRNEEQPMIESGDRIRAANEVIFVVKVPEEAEPGYHVGQIFLDPIAPDKHRMITIKALVPFTFIFKVPGNAVREGRILEISSGDYYVNRLNVEVFFENTGTVTIMPKPALVKIFDDKNETIAVLRSNIDYVKPGEVKRLIAFWPIRGVEEGLYNATAEVDYLTGKASKESVIEVYKPLIPMPKVVEKEFAFPLWLFVLLVIAALVAYWMYRG